MITQGQELAERLRVLNQEIISFIKELPDESWRTQCAGEQWPVSVVARHIGVGHYGVIELAKMMIAGTPLPNDMGAQITKGNAAHAARHADCQQEEVLSILMVYGTKVVDYVAGLSDAELETRVHIADFGGEITVKQLFKSVILRFGGEHLKSMRKALGKS